MSSFVVDLDALDSTQLQLAGGKGAHLGELCRIEGIRVPAGFCVTTRAFETVLGQAPAMGRLLDQLAGLQVSDREAIQSLCGEIRQVIEGIPIPEAIRQEIREALGRQGEEQAFAVRSSATAEDLPTASFAGQQDSYLNIRGEADLLRSISRCWASLFTERAVLYRIQNGFEHRKVQLAVVVQRMVFPQAAGILFTADPVSGNRKVTSIDASFGLGEALVSGRVNPDVYKVREGQVLQKTIATKTLAILPVEEGGTREQAIEAGLQDQPALTDPQILELERQGRRIEQHFGSPQDIEWCRADGAFSIVQSRPITTLFPLPQVEDQQNHVYLSVGHQQMMTDPLKPLGLSFFLLTTRAPMRTAGGRLFVDVTQGLAAAAPRTQMLNVLAKTDPLMHDALMTVLQRDFVPLQSGEGNTFRALEGYLNLSAAQIQAQAGYDPDLVPKLIQTLQSSLATLRENLRTQSGTALFDFILDDLQELKKLMSDPRSMGLILAAMNASDWLNQHIEQWLGERGVADTLTQSVPNNVTSEMGLALLEVADAMRPYPEVLRFLEATQAQPGTGLQASPRRGARSGASDPSGPHPESPELLGSQPSFPENVPQQAPEGHGSQAVSAIQPPLPDSLPGQQPGFLEELEKREGGPEVRAALQDFLERYGMRCPGEIDITRTRWSEKPELLVPLLLANLRNFEAGAASRKFQQGLQQAQQKEQQLLAALRNLPEGDQKARETQQMIDLLRGLIGYREYPKYGMICRYFLYKQALSREAQKLVRAGVLQEQEDMGYLTFQELREAVRTRTVDEAVLRQRKAEHKLHQKLSPSRVMTSEGELLNGRYQRENLPADALVGLAVSTGVVEGRARVVLRMEDAHLEEGDILVTAFTDPSWTALFVALRGLVTEVGGLMTHGAVIAREYGIPAVVGVQDATRHIRDGQSIRVHGTEGYIEIL